ncbi:MAG: OmpA family protein, partial [Spirochaetaceae bacterium]|nr:OmpA family protein [Spirochaetaceae bacterium]
DGKFLSLDLIVDGKKTDHSETNLKPYLRNKLLPLLIILGIISLFLLLWGGKWLFSEFLFNNAAAPTSINKGKDTKSETAYEKPNKTNITIQTEELSKESEPAVVTTPEANSEALSNVKKPVKEAIISFHTAYFLPNNTSIGKDTAQKLKDLAKEIKSTPNVLVEISGYCAMTGTKEGRERLSKERAYNVLDYLKKEGWIPETEPVVQWYGGTRPVTLDQKEIYRNRRVEIKIEIQ